jgi:hypothetical protein
MAKLMFICGLLSIITFEWIMPSLSVAQCPPGFICPSPHVSPPSGSPYTCSIQEEPCTARPLVHFRTNICSTQTVVAQYQLSERQDFAGVTTWLPLSTVPNTTLNFTLSGAGQKTVWLRVRWLPGGNAGPPHLICGVPILYRFTCTAPQSIRTTTPLPHP